MSNQDYLKPQIRTAVDRIEKLYENNAYETTFGTANLLAFMPTCLSVRDDDSEDYLTFHPTTFMQFLNETVLFTEANPAEAIFHVANAYNAVLALAGMPYEYITIEDARVVWSAFRNSVSIIGIRRDELAGCIVRETPQLYDQISAEKAIEHAIARRILFVVKEHMLHVIKAINLKRQE